MTLAASILFGFPLGFLLGFRRRAYIPFTVVWAIVFVVQTLDLTFDTTAPNYGGQRWWGYWVAQPAIFALGFALLWLGARFRARHQHRTQQAV
ncbi:MAG: hypothetical protein JF888_01365 [Candidatus Dormibacteraeota bacterium]|uniref:Uncharacterized protein n=1 Tax=Candidatus Dormiibacter inghamiae TaxID=3127013 RepID=A0A934K8B3_9BACT|nr:hypothetical protein [Candidatus Dormibacteraeota bacterium]MBJ7605575.1 hypothetical protein [Candidatus Dormibacteraeota bacterium]